MNVLQEKIVFASFPIAPAASLCCLTILKRVIAIDNQQDENISIYLHLLLARSQYSEGPATGHLDTGFPWFPFVYKHMLRWLPTFQVATTYFSCSPPELNLVVTNFTFCTHVK